MNFKRVVVFYQDHQNEANKKLPLCPNCKRFHLAPEKTHIQYFPRILRPPICYHCVVRMFGRKGTSDCPVCHLEELRSAFSKGNSKARALRHGETVVRLTKKDIRMWDAAAKCSQELGAARLYEEHNNKANEKLPLCPDCKRFRFTPEKTYIRYLARIPRPQTCYHCIARRESDFLCPFCHPENYDLAEVRSVGGKSRPS